MASGVRCLLALALLLAASACGSEQSSPAQSLSWQGRTRGGAVVLSRDEKVAVVSNRSAGAVTVFQLDPDAPVEELVVGHTVVDLDGSAGRPPSQHTSEPWAAVIGPDDDSAFVVSRFDQTVTRIVDLHGMPRIEGVVPVGSEPTAIAISPSGVRLFVANWGEGSLTVITTPDFVVRGKLDLNQPLAELGLLGGIDGRPGLAHPRALALTDDGDDDDGDETLYATEFFSQPLDASEEPRPDCARQGVVYPVPLGQGAVSAPILIEPVCDTGFLDSNQNETGCFPNQLYSAVVQGDRLFVTSLCASPEGPLGPAKPLGLPEGTPKVSNFKTVVHPSVFVIDTTLNRELPEQRQILTYELERRYAEDGAGNVRMPLIPNDFAFAGLPRGGEELRRGCLTAMGADAVFCIEYDGAGQAIEYGVPGRRYVDLAPHDKRAGRLPVGIALSQRRNFGLVVSEGSQTLSVLDLENGSIAWVGWTARELPYAEAVLRSPENAGRRHFATGLDVWSLDGQGWLSCESCHPDGLSDGVTWFFARGPRQTLSTAPTYYGNGARRVLLWGGNVDEVHDVEGVVRSVAGGVGAALWQYQGDAPDNGSRIVFDGGAVPPGKPTTTLRNNLNGSLKQLFGSADVGGEVCNKDAVSCDRSPAHEWDEMDAFIRSVRTPLRPTGLDSARVERGAQLFRDGGCPGCHGGAGWTVSRVFYTPGPENNGSLPSVRPQTLDESQLGRLRLERYTVAEALRPLNPPAWTGTSTLRRWTPGFLDPIVYLYGNEKDDGFNSKPTHADDQINCVLRAVGTFPDLSNGREPYAVVPADAPVIVREVRDNMAALALGESGYNVPSLLGVATGAPYFHAGNARTLEEAFDSVFTPHHRALAPDFLVDDSERRERVADLVAYLLSIDDGWPIETFPVEFDLCASVAAEFD